MKANVQYNDFKGTSAADISDHTNLTEYLEERKVDTEVYKPIGVEFYGSDYGLDLNLVNFSIICKDTNTGKIVKIQDARDQKFQDFIRLFKRFNVIVTEHSYLDSELQDSPIYIEDLISKKK